MDTQRLILFVIFSFSALFLWEAWQREHAPPPPVTQAAPGKAAESPLPASAPGVAAGANPNATS
ncbi:MAG TPA: membrane protein insertase YidC, partial [Casimicrobiaceae bacterium]|nr:membrane protein insertase YidC [Casimicrobiaceae bacterium]